MFQQLLTTSGNSMPIYMVAIIALMFVLMYFTSIRPQKKREKQHQEMMSAMKKGDRVMTIGGFYAKVFKVEDDAIIVELLPDNIKAKVTKQAIAKVLTEDETTAEN
jgi:preprotein translocase subunit YajC